MSGSSNRPPERPPVRPTLQRALMQQRQRSAEPTFDDSPDLDRRGYDQPGAAFGEQPYPAPSNAADYDPYGIDQYPDDYKTGAPAADEYGADQYTSDQYRASYDDPRTGQPTGSQTGHPSVHAALAAAAAAQRPALAPPEPSQRSLSRSEHLAPALERVSASRPSLSAERTAEPLSSVAPAAPEDMYAETRLKGRRRGQSSAPIVPAGSVTGKSLTLVISIMCFLACLTAGAVYMMNQSAAAWLRDIASEVTVQIEAKDKVDPEKQLRDVSQFLARQPGVRNVRPLSVADSAQLLEPWLGQSDALKSLPIPRLIALEVDRAQPPDLAQIRTQLAAQFKGVSLDDHRHWQQQIRTVTRSFALGGLAILMLVGAATTAIIVSATRSALGSNRDIVEVLHFVGATDKFIAREFEKHFLRLGIKAGLVGALSAMAVFLSLPFVMELLGGGTVTVAEIRRMIGSGTLDVAGYVLLGIVVVVIAALCMLTSRIGVYRILHTQR